MSLFLAEAGLLGNTTKDSIASSFDEQFNLFSRIETVNGVIPFITFSFIIIYFLLKLLVWWWVVWITQCCLNVLSCGRCGSTEQIAPERKFLPGYTEDHVTFVADSNEGHLTRVEKEQGWVCKQNSDGILLRYKVWMEDGSMSELRHHKGEKKKTWQVIRDTALHTYDISENPNYSDAFSGRRRSVKGALGGAVLGAGGV